MTIAFRKGWEQVALCFVLMAVGTMIASTFTIVAVPLSQEFQTSRMVLMLAMTVSSAVTMVLAPFAGNLMDRWSLRRLLLIGSALVVSGHLALSFTASFFQVLLVYGLLMAPAGILMGPIFATVLLSRWFVRQRGRALGIAIAGISAGGVILPLVVQGLLSAFPWREALQVLAAILLVVTIPLAALIVDRPSDRGLSPDGDPESAAEAARKAAPPPPVSARQILTDPTFWLIAAMIGVVSSGMKGLVTNLGPMAMDEGIPPEVAALLVSFFSSCSFAAKLIFAALADKVPLRALLLVLLTGFIAGMMLLTQVHAGTWVLAVGIGFVGLFGAVMLPMQSFLAARVFGAGVVGKAMGLLGTVMLVLSLAMPPFFGLIFDMTGSYAVVFVTLAALAGAVMLTVPYIRLQSKEHQPQPAGSPA